MMPVGLGVARDAGLQLATIAPTIAIPAGFAFAFPIGTPANAIAYSSGYLKLRDLIIPGMLLGLMAWLTFIVAVQMVIKGRFTEAESAIGCFGEEDLAK